MTHICVGNLTIIGPDNGLTPGRRQAIIWTNDGILLIGPLGTNFSEISIKILTMIFIHKNTFESVICEMASILSRPECVNCLNTNEEIYYHISQGPMCQCWKYSQVKSPSWETLASRYTSWQDGRDQTKYDTILHANGQFIIQGTSRFVSKHSKHENLTFTL